MGPKFDYDDWKLNHETEYNPVNNKCPECGTKLPYKADYCQICEWVYDEDYDGDKAALNRDKRHNLRKLRGDF